MKTIPYREAYIALKSQHCDENFARTRRVIFFEETTGLVEVQMAKARHIYDQIPPRSRDHATAWTDGDEFYVLCEPYSHGDIGKNPAGLVNIRLPHKLAPYCGMWDPDPDSEPRTISRLYTTEDNVSGLLAIKAKLQGVLKTALPWNTVK
ncbi:MAG: hypothetical protein HOM20_12675 [Porticoccaceae bacterium]|jgi:hypothetical protein|nr:hypothetical protein [Porticoccaceae bacterium]